MDYHNRLEALIKRRNIDLSDVKFRGRLRTVKWAVYEATQKNALLKDLGKEI
jgi:hypothetical protein